MLARFERHLQVEQSVDAPADGGKVQIQPRLGCRQFELHACAGDVATGSVEDDVESVKQAGTGSFEIVQRPTLSPRAGMRTAGRFLLAAQADHVRQLCQNVLAHL